MQPSPRGWGKLAQPSEPRTGLHLSGTQHSHRTVRPPPLSTPQVFTSPGKETHRHSTPSPPWPGQPLSPFQGCAVPVVWPGHRLLLCSPAGGHAGCFHTSANVKGAAASWCLTRFSHSCEPSVTVPALAMAGERAQRA